jgi:hypothetical protein
MRPESERAVEREGDRHREHEHREEAGDVKIHPDDVIEEEHDAGINQEPDPAYEGEGQELALPAR